MSYTSLYPSTFNSLLAYKNIAFNENADAQTENLYSTFDRWIRGAYDIIEAHCGQSILKREDALLTFNMSDLIYTSTGDVYIALPVLNVPIIINSIFTKYSQFDNAAEIVSSEYKLVHSNGLELLFFLDKNIPVRAKTLICLTDVGYDEAAMPELVRQVCVEIVAEIYAESDNGMQRLGVASKSDNFQGVSATSSYYQLSAKHKKILSKYSMIFP